MSGALGRFWQRLTGRWDRPDLPVPPALYAVGDIHGRLDLYRPLERKIAEDAEGAGALIVVLGDLIDRGPDSRGVIDHMLEPPPQGCARLCLMGNHEDILLRFLAAPEPNAQWLDWGGRPTLQSYGVTVTDDEGQVLPPPHLRKALADALPDAHLRFLRRMPLMATVGRHVLSHAGLMPEVPIAKQTKADLIWSRQAEVEDALPPADLGARISVHGHIPVPQPLVRGWRIDIDTNAWSTGRLTAARLSEDAPPYFLTT